jgi:hypothetical protein
MYFEVFSYLEKLFIGNPLAQTIGLFAMIVTVWSFAFLDEKKFRTVMLIGQMIFVTHFMMLGAYMGAIWFWLAAARTFWSTFINKKQYVYWMFFGLYLFIGYFKVNTWYDTLPLIWGLTGMTWLFFARGIWVRYFYIIAPAIILMYNIIVGSIGGVINETLVIMLNTWTIFRIFQKNTNP